MSNEQTPERIPGTFGWNELLTSDTAAAEKFYSGLYGWTAETQTMAPGMDYTVFSKNGAMVAGMMAITDEMKQMGVTQSHWLAYVISTDIRADIEKARTGGATILKDAMAIPTVGTLAVIADPTGAVSALWQEEVKA